jgi:hypothetical protein
MHRIWFCSRGGVLMVIIEAADPMKYNDWRLGFAPNLTLFVFFA